MAIVPLAHGAWIDHDPAWLSASEADALLAAVREELACEQREIVLFGRPVLQPRLIEWAGELGYRYSGQTLRPRPFTPAVARALDAVMKRTSVPFNHVLANRYRDGRDSMGLHADDERELGEDPAGTCQRHYVHGIPRRGVPLGSRPAKHVWTVTVARVGPEKRNNLLTRH